MLLNCPAVVFCVWLATRCPPNCALSCQQNNWKESTMKKHMGKRNKRSLIKNKTKEKPQTKNKTIKPYWHMGVGILERQT